MVKIKREVKKNLPQLIEWGLKNGIKNKHYVSENHYIVTFDKIGFFENSTLPLDEIFTVEVEEEITEDTVLGKAIEVYSDKYDDFLATSCEGKSVKDILDSNVGNDTKTEKIYLFNDDDTMTLIWRDGKLVE